MRIPAAVGAALLVIPGTAFGAALQRREASHEELSVVTRDVQGEQPHQLQKRNPAVAAAIFFGQFALEYAMGKGLDSIFGDPDAEPPLTAEDLAKFGDEMLEGIETIVTEAISDFQEQRDKQNVDADLKSLASWRPTADLGDLSGLQGDERALERKNAEFNRLIEFLQTPSYSVFATPYFLAVAGAKIHLWRMRIRIAQMIAEAQAAVVAAGRSAEIVLRPNNTDPFISTMKQEAASFATACEAASPDGRFGRNARQAINKMVYRECRDQELSGVTSHCRVDTQCVYKIKLPTSDIKTVFRGDASSGWHKKTGCSGFACSVPQCKGSDWDRARQDSYDLPNLQSEYWMGKHYKKTMTNSEMGVMLLTADYTNIVNNWRFVAKYGIADGFKLNPASVHRPCIWVRKVHQFKIQGVDIPGVQASPAEMDVCTH
ncbi:hypothetical protein BDW02DRAFT_565825 [Decorospora gaudefroyi]|uniref:Uncharacterized protein n=1 Tax=Decorospora gaudefroyi TaxID=184978 RepID=A0A6A5KHF3_9PLEO|nr:hypothetical protein BDW02DRAFT_565825 [Decorospora gaudefroyi]